MSTIAEYILNSENLGRNDADKLEELKEKYNYFQVLHILIAKSHKNQNTFGFNKNLRIASMYAGDRRILYNFINKETQSIVDESVVDIKIDEIITKQADESLIQEYEPEIVKNIIPEPLELNKEELKSTEISIENINVSETDEKESEPIEIENIIEKIDTNTTIKVEIESEHQPEPEPEPEPEQLVETETTNQVLDLTVEIIETPVFVEPIKQDTTFEKPKLSSDEMSFLDWLDEFGETEKNIDTKNETNIDITEEIEQVNKEEEQYDPVGWAEIAYEIQAFVKQPDEPNAEKQERLSREEVDNILDSFINKNPSISRTKAEFYKPENMARKSEEFNTEVISETLAELFYKQGLLHKALEMFEKLMLQSPNKKDIFAAKIKNIKEELINKL